MSLLLLFQNHPPAPSINGSAAAGAGGSARSTGARGAVGGPGVGSGGDSSAATGRKAATYGAAAVAGALGISSGIHVPGRTAAAIAGAFAAAVGHGDHVDSGAHAVAGAYARQIGARGAPGSSAAVAGALARIRARALRVGTPVEMLTRIVLFLDPNSVSFTRVGESGPFPLLLSIDTLRIACRAGQVSGIGSSESTSVSASFDNTGGKAAEILGRPLRIQAEIYDGPDLFFTGTVSGIQYGQTITLNIEA
jgi:hypothetical protein